MLRPAVALLVLLLIVIALVNLSGRDSESLYPAEGTLRVNGKPAHGAVVVFHPQNSGKLSATQPVGYVGPDGRYRLTSTNRVGAPPGDYVVTVSWFVPAQAKTTKKSLGFVDPEKGGTVEKLGFRYSNRQKSTITRTLVRGNNEVEPIELTDTKLSP